MENFRAVKNFMNTNPKVELLPPRRNPYAWSNPNTTEVDLKKSLPYFKTQSGNYIHRIRSATMHFWSMKYSHTAFNFWCGMTGFSSDKHKASRLMPQPPPDGVVCSTCEGRAIGAGQNDSHKINGHFVKFSPKLR